MSKSQDRKNIVQNIIRAANLYKQHLVGKRFLYVFDNRYIEVIYKASNFRHLTGVDTQLSAKDFYRLACNKKLQVNQINFSSKHPYNLCAKKVKHLEEIATLAGSENFMLEEITTQTQTYKFGTTDLNFSLCMNKETDETGAEKGDCYVVQSLRDEDCFSKSKEAYVVTHILSRPNDKKEYTDILYVDSNNELLPDNLLALLSMDLKTKLSRAQELE